MTNNKLIYKSEPIFRKWLQENIHHFNYKPVLNAKEEFTFDGVTEAVSLSINFSRPEAELSFNDINSNENYDYYTIQYIGNEQYNEAKGFYDADRVDSVYTYYDTYEELVITEVFEPIIEYCNNNFKDSNSLYLINYGGSTEGFIAPTDETKTIPKLNMLRRLNRQYNGNLQFFKYQLITQT